MWSAAELTALEQVVAAELTSSSGTAVPASQVAATSENGTDLALVDVTLSTPALVASASAMYSAVNDTATFTSALVTSLTSLGHSIALVAEAPVLSVALPPSPPSLPMPTTLTPPPASTPAAADADDEESDDGDDAETALVVSLSVVGGLIGLCLLGMGALFAMRKRNELKATQVTKLAQDSASSVASATLKHKPKSRRGRKKNVAIVPAALLDNEMTAAADEAYEAEESEEDEGGYGGRARMPPPDDQQDEEAPPSSGADPPSPSDPAPSDDGGGGGDGPAAAADAPPPATQPEDPPPPEGPASTPSASTGGGLAPLKTADSLAPLAPLGGSPAPPRARMAPALPPLGPP